MIPITFWVLVSAAFAEASLSGSHKQYYLQSQDGAYQYGYDTGATHGISHVQQGDAVNQVQGQFYYTSPDGSPVSLSYTAGVQGYVPSGGAVAESGSGSFLGHSGHSISTAYTAGTSGQISKSQTSYGSSGIEKSIANEQPSGDASYKFAIDSDEYKRNEQSDSQGNIQGQYSYIGKEGGLHGLTYIAGEGLGFLVTSSTGGAAGSSIAGSPIQSTPTQYTATTGGSSYSYGNALANQIGYQQSSYGKSLGSSLIQKAGPNADGSYSFAYQTPDHSRQESSDGLNNVRGSYTVTSGGSPRRIDYVAGANTGFVASGDIQPVNDPSFKSQSTSLSGVSIPAHITSYTTNQQLGYGKSLGDSLIQKTGPNADGTYSFSYQTSDHSRQESADGKNNVRGSYTVTSGGSPRRIDYVAGANTGFVASGDIQPVNDPSFKSQSNSVSGVSIPAQITSYTANQPSDASYAFSYQTGDSSRVESSDTSGNIKGSYSFIAKDNGQQHTVNYEAGAEKGFIAEGQHLSKTLVPEIQGYSHNSKKPYLQEQGDNAAFSYSYKTDSSSKQEASDGQGNVRGSFEQLGADGVLRKADYTSLGEEGFKIKQSDLGKAIVQGPASFASSAQYTGLTNINQHASSPYGSRGLQLLLKGGKVNTYLPPEPSYGYQFRASY